jgi:hypothetical protein
MTNAIEQFNVKQAARPPMSLELRSRLKREFLADVEELSRLLGRDLTCWCQD